MITATDLFCGAGGSSEGLRQAGWNVEIAANHWDVAVARWLGTRVAAALGHTEQIVA